MKKIFLLAVACITVQFLLGQKLQKGNLVGLHVMTVELQPGATMEQVKQFYLTEYIPETEKAFKNVKGYIVEARRGELENVMGIIWLFNDEASRDRYFNSEELNDHGKAAMEKIKPVNEKRNKLATVSTKYVDWIVQ